MKIATIHELIQTIREASNKALNEHDLPNQDSEYKRWLRGYNSGLLDALHFVECYKEASLYSEQSTKETK